MGKTYIPINDIQPGLFSSHRIGKVRDYEGKMFEIYFDQCHTNENSDNSLLEVQVLDEDIEKGLILLAVPHGNFFGVYGHGEEASRCITVEKSSIVFKN
ncbi:hypothetical protein HYW74_02495 [Candidatus Pacearchaeota archaeon]|nr:hypothetical protein [Candidatus Pacearchaeota archaeon]